MCGIAGFINYSNKEKLANKANVIQFHRGPDNQSTWNDDLIALSHQRLSIIDLSASADQPLMKDDLVIIFNGEIYNYKKLKEEYLSDINFITDSDTEVILEMYKKFKQSCLEYFLGMFSFVIYSKKTKKLFAARDHFGIKPFYYIKNGNKMAFASELKTLSKLIPFSKKINRKALISSLNYLWVPGSQTIFSDILKLSAGHYFEYDIKNDDFKINKYWELSTELINFQENDLNKKLYNEYNSSIKRHMVSDVPVSSFLSGGLDSSMISVSAGKINNNLSTYTIGTSKEDKNIENMPEDEKYAKIVANINNFDHNEIIVKSDITKILPKIVYSLDEPIGDPAAINTYLICSEARKNGSKVLLSGMGADEIFCGYRRQKALLYSQNYKKLPKIIRKIIRKVVSSLPVKVGPIGLRLFRWSKKFISFAEMPIEEAYRMSYSYYDRNELNDLLLDESNEIIDSIYEDHKQIFDKEYKDDLVNKMCYTDIHMFMNGLNLAYTDKSSMAASVEVRVPFIDKQLINFAMSIPGNFKFFNKQSKYILKKIAEKLLPNKIIYRPKASFGAPIRSWISGDLKDMVDEYLSEDNINKRKIFNYSKVRDMIEKDRLGKEDNAYKIYQLLTLELWFKAYLD